MAEQSRQIIYIDSAKRNPGGTATDFAVTVRTRSESFDRVTLLSATIPKTFYLVDDHYRSFTLEEDGKQVEVKLDAGDYDYRSFRLHLTETLNEVSPSGWIYSIEYPSSRNKADTGLYTYSVAGNGGIQPKFIMDVSLSRMMGFDMNTTYTFVNDQLKSTNVLSFQAISTLFVSSDIVGGENETDILQEIFAAGVPFMDNIVYECPDVEACSRKITDIRKDLWRFWLLDQTGKHVDLNGYSVVLSLLLYNSKTYEGLSHSSKIIAALKK